MKENTETWDTSQGREFVRGHGAFSLRQTTQKSRLKFKENNFVRFSFFNKIQTQVYLNGPRQKQLVKPVGDK